MDKEKQQQINWFFNFAYQAIDGLDDFGAWLLFVQVMLAKERLFYQQMTKAQLLGYAKFLMGPVEGEAPAAILKDEQTLFQKDFFNILADLDKTKQAGTIENTPLVPAHSVTLNTETNIQAGIVRVKFGPQADAHMDDKRLLLAFLQALSDVSVDNIRSCPECDRWFPHFTRRTRTFCSNSCAARKLTRDRRAKLKAKYPGKYKQMLADNAKRARQSYVRKQERKKK
jgi:hypothetical protein